MRQHCHFPKWAALLLMGCIKSSVAAGDTIPGQTSTLDIATAILAKSGLGIQVSFSQDLTRSGPQFTVTGASLQGGPPNVSVVSSDWDVVVANFAQITLSAALTSTAGVKICFPQVEWVEANKKPVMDHPACAQLTQDYTAAKAAALADLTGVPKSSSEKNVFASGFVALASGTSQGGGNISLNPDLGIPGMTTFLNIDKATIAKGDPKMFSAGIGYQTVLPWGRSEVRAMASAKDEQTLATALSNRQKRIFGGALVNLQAKLEADPGSFKVTNFVGDVDLTLRSRTKRLGTSNGYWRGFLMPFGFEAGQNLAAGDIVPTASGTSSSSAAATPAITSVNHVARYLAGLNFDTFYENWNSQLPFKRIELEANALGRFLFLKEAMYNSTSNLYNTVGDGVRGYGNLDLKLYVGHTSAARYGIKLTYAVGSLPPVFARVKTFQIGLLYETKDDKTKGK